MDLPTAWKLDDKSSYLSVDESGLRVDNKGFSEGGAIRTNHPIPPQCKLFYFEVDIIDEGKNKWIVIGFAKKRLDYGSWGYHGDDGDLYCFPERGNPYGPSFSTGDTIGCCLNFRNNTVFYTKNGINLGIAFRSLKGTLYPCVGLWSKGGSIEVNFGSRKFKFAETTGDDIDDKLLKNKWIDAFNMCINTMKIYTIEDLENFLEINQYTALKFRVKFNFTMGRYDDAIVDLTKLVDIELSDNVDELLKKQLIEAFNMCNNAANTYTLEDLENSLKINQDSTLKFRVKFNFIMGRYKDAIIDLTKLLDIEPYNKLVLGYRGEAYYLMERYKEAIIDLTNLLYIEPNNKFALRYRGEAYYLTENIGKQLSI
ncbi:concanavalin A-like lectin/glucanase domain-containing protein [Gigaspora rosea]|uniref:Concanavalin A-like lectin/glucanase domain-containing protein n=1 Tax=Gigaspora rosea TaxID=44941 RepID=A0A397TVT1_9GLOM|nr:concanavalin A-like lectin/glucanase domain-containing protein [Gigaspora rosea]